MSKNKSFYTELAEVKPWDKGVPKINGPRVFGAYCNSPFFFSVPVVGERPLIISAEDLPEGLSIDSATGIIFGSVAREIEATVRINVRNNHGSDEYALKIVVGNCLALTPPLGWNSWNLWERTVDEEKIRDCAKNMVSSGLAAYGFSYVNIDDGWQGERGGPLGAIQPNEKFSDMKNLCNYVHSLGLRLGIYSTPWVKSFAGRNGGSTGKCIRCDRNYTTAKYRPKEAEHYFGEFSHHREDAKQWAEWGIDYLKYDWGPWKVPDVEIMHSALKESGRDIIYSLSNTAPFENVSEWVRLAHCWRTTGDITDTWESVSEIGFSQDKWTPYAGPGHWNDIDMLVIGNLGWGEQRKTRLTQDEQIAHITLWAILSSPLLLGCNLSNFDEFTLKLMCNDEVLAVNQDMLGRQAYCVRDFRKANKQGQTTVHESIYEKQLNDSSLAVGLFNRAEFPGVLEVTWKDLGIQGNQLVRDIWANKDIGKFEKKFSIGVPSHGARFVLIKKSN